MPVGEEEEAEEGGREEGGGGGGKKRRASLNLRTMDWIRCLQRATAFGGPFMITTCRGREGGREGGREESRKRGRVSKDGEKGVGTRLSSCPSLNRVPLSLPSRSMSQ